MPSSNQLFRLIGKDEASAAFLEVAAASKLLKSNIDDVNSSLLGLTKLAGGASLIPVLAGATAVITELGTALTAASLSAGVFGLSAGGIVKDMLTQQKAIGVTQTSLAKLTKGSADYNSKLIELHAQQKAFNKEFGPAAKGYTDMGTAFTKFKDATSKVTTHVLGDAFEGIAKVLPKLVPVSNAAGKAVGGLIDEMVQGIDGPGFAHFLDFLETSGPRDITAFGHIIGNTIGGLGGIFSNFVGPGDHAAATLERLTKRFDTWGHSKGVSDSVNRFLRYVHDNGPEIDATFKALAEASPKIATSLGQLGSLNLSLTSRFLTLVAGLPQKQFNLIADGLFAIAAGSKALTLVTGLGAVGKGLAGILAGKGLIGGAGGKAGPILADAKDKVLAAAKDKVLGDGVQKVFVVNPGFGKGGGGTPGVPGSPVVAGGGGILSKLLPATLGITALTGIQVGARKILQQEYGKTIGGVFSNIESALLGLPPPSTIQTQWDHIWKPVFSNIGGAVKNLGVPHIGDLFDMPSDNNKPTGIKSTSTQLDALNQKLSKASQGMELVGHSAQRAVGGDATKAVQNVSAKLDALNGNHASAQMELVGHSAQRAGNVAGVSIDVLSGKINHIPNKEVKVTANTSAAMAALLNIQAYQIRDKSFTVTQYTTTTVADHVKKHAVGGYITGPGSGTSDSILARLSNGEFVLSAAAVRKYGLSRLRDMNALRYASGGPVGSTSSRGHDKAGTVVTYNINVTAPVGSDAYTIGESLKQYLDDYENASVS